MGETSSARGVYGSDLSPRGWGCAGEIHSSFWCKTPLWAARLLGEAWGQQLQGFPGMGGLMLLHPLAPPAGLCPQDRGSREGEGPAGHLVPLPSPQTPRYCDRPLLGQRDSLSTVSSTGKRPQSCLGAGGHQLAAGGLWSGEPEQVGSPVWGALFHSCVPRGPSPSPDRTAPSVITGPTREGQTRPLESGAGGPWALHPGSLPARQCG